MKKSIGRFIIALAMAEVFVPGVVNADERPRLNPWPMPIVFISKQL